ncbi:Fc.00g039550.m01.CDS01 [Cosmosporella sp. VM-42]
MSEHIYHYKTLLGPRTIRLLELFSASHDSAPISVTLHHHDLDSAPEYEAISYVWRDPASTRSILCDSIPLQTTESLHDALNQSRLKSKSRLLWTDALYQRNLNERASQVLIMHHIYKSSQRCLIWLGQRDEHSPIALKVIQDMTVILCKEKGISVEDIDKDLNENGRDLLLTQRLGFDGLPPQTPHLGLCLQVLWPVMVYESMGKNEYIDITKTLLSCQVIQELYFAPSSLFCCGADDTTFAPLYHASHWILANYNALDRVLVLSTVETFTNWSSNIAIMPGDRIASRKDQAVDELLYDSLKFKATDPRDKFMH